jgi:antitoxin VapB
MASAKLFQNGRSQAVRLPKAFRFEGSEVKVCRVGKSVLLTPMDMEPWGGLKLVAATAGDFPAQIEAPLEQERDLAW